MSAIRGGCLCGAVQFTAAPPCRWVAHCHCSLCRRAHGAGFVTWAGFAATSVRIDDPAGHLRWFASSAEAQRGFCGRCGSPMFFRSQQWPEELHIARALVADPLDRGPQIHVFWDDHVDWALPDPADGLPRRPATP